jgi:ubiquitin conjugation factor E4 B
MTPQAMKFICESNKILDTATRSEQFLGPELTAPSLATHTMLGPFFAISPLQKEYYEAAYTAAAQQVRSHNREQLPPQVRDIQLSQNLSLRAHHDDLLYIVNKVIRASSQARDRMLDWFALCLNLNVKRGGLQWDSTLVSPDGFMNNVAIIMDRLCEPFMDNSFEKV